MVLIFLLNSLEALQCILSVSHSAICFMNLTLFHSDWSKLHRVLAILGAIGLIFIDVLIGLIFIDVSKGRQPYLH